MLLEFQMKMATSHDVLENSAIKTKYTHPPSPNSAPPKEVKKIDYTMKQISPIPLGTTNFQFINVKGKEEVRERE